MKISEILSKDCIFTQVKAQNKKQALQILAQKAAQSAGIDEHTAVDSVWERETLGSTGYGNGTAFPHARIVGLQKIKAVFAKLENAVDFKSVDSKPVDLVFMLVSPENSGADHLEALAAVSRMLKNDTVCQKIRNSKSAEEIYALLNN